MSHAFKHIILVLIYLCFLSILYTVLIFTCSIQTRHLVHLYSENVHVYILGLLLQKAETCQFISVFCKVCYMSNITFLRIKVQLYLHRVRHADFFLPLSAAEVVKPQCFASFLHT